MSVPELPHLKTVFECAVFVEECKRSGRRGRPRENRARFVCNVVVRTIEQICGCRLDLPRSPTNDVPHGIETITREIFGKLGVKANAKKMLDTVLAERCNKVAAVESPRGITAEQFFANKRGN